MAAPGKYSAGTIFLQVVPVFRDTMDSIRDETKKLSGAIGDDLEKAGREGGKRAGKAMGEELSKEAAKEVAKAKPIETKAKVKVEVDDSELGDFDRRIAKTARDMAKALGDNVTGETKRIKKSLEDIGNVKIGAQFDGTRALADIRRYAVELDRKVPKKIVTTADMQIASAVAKGAQLSKIAGTLDGKKIEVQASLRGATTTIAQMGALNAILGAFQPRANAAGTASENAANSFRSFNFRILGAVTLLPALIPMLGALGGGLLALIPILGAVGAGIGTMILGFSGIGEAVKQMGNVADEQKIASGKAAAGAKQVATATHAVADAERALADARRNAARANKDAERAVADARRNAADAIEDAYERKKDAAKDYRDAVEDVRDAEEDLRQARIDAAADAADLATRQRKNALDEREALADLFDAQVEFNAVMGDGSSTTYDKERASIGLEAAQIALNDTRTEQAALTAEAEDYAKNGVDGTEQVKDAQDAVTTALEAQKEAQEAAKEAAEEYKEVQLDAARQISDALRNQARTAADGARSVADAQRGVARAQEGVADAVTAATDESTAAVDNLALAMDKLSPAGQKFARFLFGLREGFRETRDAVQEAMLPGIQQGLQIIIDTYGPQFRAFVVDFANRIGDLGTEMGRGLAGPEWKAFFAAYAKLAPQLFEDSAKTGGNFMTALAGVFEVIAPYAERLSEAMLHISERASVFFNSANGKNQVREFMEYAFEAGPKVVRFFADLAKFGVDIAKALEPFGTAVMDGLSAFFEWIDDLDPKIVSLMATAFIGLLVAFQLAVGAFALVAAGGAVFGSIAGAVVFSAVAIATAVFAAYQNFELVRDILDPIIDKFKDLAGFLIDNADVLVKVVAGVLALYGAIKVVQGIMLAWRIITLNLAFAQLILNAALFANPIGLVVLAIIAVIAILVAAYYKFDWFRALVDKVWAGIKIGFGLMVEGMKWAWENILKPTFTAIWDTVKFLWQKIIKPYLTFIVDLWTTIFKVMQWYWKNILWPVLDMIFTVVGKLWLTLFKPVLQAIKERWESAFNAMKTIWETVLKPVFKAIGDFMTDTVVPKFESAIGTIKSLWEGLKDAFAAPVKFLIESVINHGIIDAFNFVAEKVGSTKMGYASVPGWANGTSEPSTSSTTATENKVKRKDGGTLPGYTPGRDVHQFYSPTAGYLDLSGGEAIMRPEWTSAVGPGYVEYMNNLARRGPGAVKRALGGGQAFAKGGIFFPLPGGAAARTAYNLGHDGMDINAPGDEGMTFYSATSGKVTTTGYSRGYGNAVFVMSPYGELVYGHSQDGSIRVAPGQAVMPGTPLARVGNTGRSYGAHLHFGFPGGTFGQAAALLAGVDPGVVGKKGPMHVVPDWAKDIVAKPMEWAKNSITAPLQQFKSNFGSSPYVDLLSQVPVVLAKQVGSLAKKSFSKKAFDAAGNVITGGLWGTVKDAAGKAKDAVTGEGGAGVASEAYRNGGILPYNGAMMYDSGGYLPPGLTTVMNLTGKPEPVFTANQFDKMGTNGGESFTYSPTFNGTDLTAADVVDDLDFYRRRAGREGKYGRSMT